MWEIIVLERYKEAHTLQPEPASILLTQRFSHRGIIMPELHGLSWPTARGTLNAIETCDYSPLLYSMNCSCVGCKRHVWSIRQEEIFISDGQGFRRSGNH